MIPFNKPYLHGRELEYISQAVASGKISGDGVFTCQCHQYFESRYHFQRAFLTTSCTDALEMSALLLEIGPGDEVILPSYTFVSTANAFALRGAKLVFADSSEVNPNIDPRLIESLVTPATKAIVVVHYAGIACAMTEILDIARRHRLHIVEDAAQAIDSFYMGKPLGSFGTFSTFSFHETKNITCGEGGMLVVNNLDYVQRAEIIREKGTNRSAFFRGEIDKYGWVDLGSSFLPSELNAAFLYAQIEVIEKVQARRLAIWERYHSKIAPVLSKLGIGLPVIPSWGTNNGHLFYLICRDGDERQKLINHLRERGVMAVFHYQSLHRSAYFSARHDGRHLPNADHYSDCLLRLPLYYDLRDAEVDFIVEGILEFYDGAQ